MKKIFTYTCIVACALAFCSCAEDAPRAKSIFEDPDRSSISEIEQWLLQNYTYPYNIQYQYKLQDVETDRSYEVVPAIPDKALALAKILKHMFYESYDELLGVNFLRTHSQRVIHVVGSGAYTTSSVLKGTAESGMKITLYLVNDLTATSVNQELLSEYYLKTMFHEFSHILHQKKAYTSAFRLITPADYLYNEWNSAGNTLEIALQKGFISKYARDEPDEDFVEIIAFYVVKPDGWWEEQMAIAGEPGASLLAAKLDIVKAYLKDVWELDIDYLRAVVQRRFGELNNLDLTDLLK
ncbi:MAG: putative zinc-binding metallopeptidase [Odoribacteraceae bacterium]|jgi:substrate import-associated zinc metallohydrolase lipoprotein|nr:putative zinc-binding metallopeptidase [Odoribacteraceae bacterium]